MPVSSFAVLCLEMVWYHVNIAPSHDTTQLLPQYAQYAQYDSDPLRDRTGPGGSKMENTSGEHILVLLLGGALVAIVTVLLTGSYGGWFWYIFILSYPSSYHVTRRKYCQIQHRTRCSSPTRGMQSNSPEQDP